MQPSDIRTFRLLKRTAIVYLLLLYLDRPVGESEIARLLEIDRTTARKHLRSLSTIGVVSRAHFHNGYILTGSGRQMILGEPPLEQPNINGMGRFSPVSITTTIKESKYIDDLNIVEEDLTDQLVKKPPVENTPVWTALHEAGITRNRRTERLSQLPHITPEYITGHPLALQRAGKGSHTGLLVTILESGEPAPELNENRHLTDCDCLECNRLKYLKCSYCGKYPCVCST